VTDDRRLGVDLNNRTWNVLDKGEVTSESPLRQREELLYGAYASTYHWMQIGTPIHQARGEHLIARAALRVGRYELALAHARRCLELVEAHPDLAEDWDHGFGHEALARALAASGERAEAERHLRLAVERGEAIVDPEERAVLQAELDRGEWFGLT
jgi:tetratricopeptide (TPR) repeat protein